MVAVAKTEKRLETDGQDELPKWNLALGFQEIFTAIVRIRSERQVVTDAEQFRAQTKRALHLAEQTAREHGCTASDIGQAIFAVVALLDETALACRNPAFADWPRLPLQAELYGHQLAGELFFQELRKVLNRPNDEAAADLLEVYELCLLLGFKGRFAAGGDLHSVVTIVREKLRLLRGPEGRLSPRGVIPVERSFKARSDPWVRTLGFAAVAMIFLSIALFIIFKVMLSAQASQLSIVQ